MFWSSCKLRQRTWKICTWTNVAVKLVHHRRRTERVTVRVRVGVRRLIGLSVGRFVASVNGNSSLNHTCCNGVFSFLPWYWTRASVHFAPLHCCKCICVFTNLLFHQCTQSRGLKRLAASQSRGLKRWAVSQSRGLKRLAVSQSRGLKRLAASYRSCLLNRSKLRNKMFKKKA